MATFAPNTPITTRVPEVAVENKLAPGQYRFQLVVEDEQGNLSQPAIHVITVRKLLVPVDGSGSTGIIPTPAPAPVLPRGVPGSTPNGGGGGGGGTGGAPVLPRGVPGSTRRPSRAGRQRATREPA